MQTYCKFFSWWVSHPLVVSRDHLKDLKYPLNSLRSKHRHSRELFRLLMMAWLVELWGRNERQYSGARFSLFFTTGSHVWKLYTSEPVLGFQYLSSSCSWMSRMYPARYLFETFIQNPIVRVLIPEASQMNWNANLEKHHVSYQSMSKFVYFCCCLVAKLYPMLSRPHGLQPARLLCPWNFPGENNGVGCHFSSSGDLPNSAMGLASPALTGGFFMIEPVFKSYFF